MKFQFTYDTYMSGLENSDQSSRCSSPKMKCCHHLLMFYVFFKPVLLISSMADEKKQLKLVSCSWLV